MIPDGPDQESRSQVPLIWDTGTSRGPTGALPTPARTPAPRRRAVVEPPSPSNIEALMQKTNAALAELAERFSHVAHVVDRLALQADPSANQEGQPGELADQMSGRWARLDGLGRSGSAPRRRWIGALAGRGEGTPAPTGALVIREQLDAIQQLLTEQRPDFGGGMGRPETERLDRLTLISTDLANSVRALSAQVTEIEGALAGGFSSMLESVQSLMKALLASSSELRATSRELTSDLAEHVAESHQLIRGIRDDLEGIPAAQAQSALGAELAAMREEIRRLRRRLPIRAERPQERSS